MDFKSIVLVTLTYLSLVQSNDIRLGYTASHSRKIYSEIKEVNPAIWRRSDDIIINAPNNEIISAVYVTDLRENKDGEAFIQSGGIGERSVTVELKSPTVLRGYKFEIEVFSENPHERYQSKGYSNPIYDEGQFARKF